VEKDATGGAIDDVCVDRCACAFVNGRDKLAERKDVVASVGESDAGSSIHAAEKPAMMVRLRTARAIFFRIWFECGEGLA